MHKLYTGTGLISSIMSSCNTRREYMCVQAGVVRSLLHGYQLVPLATLNVACVYHLCV
jgi:hypothetical protein